MLNKGVPDSIIDLWLGHTIGQLAQAYKTIQYDEIKKMYAEREPFISVQLGEDVGVLRKEITENHTVVSSLAEQNAIYKNRIEVLESRLAEVEKQIGEISKVKELVDDLIKQKRLEIPN
jgi:hypothetical protein